LFFRYISLGDKASSEKSYEEAEIAYREALKIKPDKRIGNFKN
jgi:cytochrome c-type biogenesis protein CcmH/NrfG